MTAATLLSVPAPRNTGSLLSALVPQPANALLALIARHRDDPRPGKIDLGVGVYRDAAGHTPVMRAVKAAEARLLATQATKAYLGPEGDARFVDLLAPLVFGAAASGRDRLAGIQTPGGTGALRLGAELIARALPGARIWLGTPSWPNHAPIFTQAGLEVMPHRYFNATRREIDFDAMLADLAGVALGDVVLVHGCCHNPTGADFNPEQWPRLVAHIAARGALPFIDLAYQGLGDGLESDVAGLRLLVEAVPEALVAYSCDKNFALYRDRVGALWVQAATPGDVRRISDNMLALARSLWSMPPDHGAAVVRIILDDPDLADDWRAELAEMRNRINGLRRLLADAHPRLAPIGRQRGLFAMLPIDRAAVAGFRDRHGIYMADSGRINIAGLQEPLIHRLIATLTPLIDGPER